MAVLLLFVLPLTEIFLWIMLAEVWGWSGNLLEILLSGAVGLFCIKRVGLASFQGVQQAAQQGRSPAMQVLRAFCFLVGGFLLILPGVLSDVLGLVFIFPPTRYIVSTYMARSWMKSQRMWVRVGSMGNFGGFYTAYRTHQTHTQRPPERSFEDVIEVDAVDVREISADLPKDAGKDSSSES